MSDELKYDSRPETYEHIHTVQRKLRFVIESLIRRAHVHDRSKLVSPEVEGFDEYTPKLKGTTYGSDEYKEFLAGLKVSLDHHYAANDHHPEHFKNGIKDMDLIQLIEMFCDWLAATERHDDGDIYRSIEINAERFGYGEEIKSLLINTAEYFD